MTPPRVLLVEDDAAVRLLVELALEDLPLELVSCAGAAEALQALARAPFQLIVTDLMMPGISGAELLQRLHDEPALAAGARRVVFSAGLDAATRTRLQALGAWRFLHKPVAVQALRDCVAEALELAAAPEPEPSPPDAGGEAELAALIAEHFAGDAELFAAYRASCLAQFGADAAAAEAALRRRDAPTLRRLAHSLKTVLASLGEAAEAARAKALEQAGAAADWPVLEMDWPLLAAGLRRLAAASN